jgi:hypothetical protein
MQIVFENIAGEGKNIFRFFSKYRLTFDNTWMDVTHRMKIPE